jgi:multisubunit Na+/H+ antiporter MnhG subunit
MPQTEMILAPASTEVLDIVKETLADVTPRAAALALMRFPDYLELIQKAGVETTEDLCTALFDELRAICQRDAA